MDWFMIVVGMVGVATVIMLAALAVAGQADQRMGAAHHTAHKTHTQTQTHKAHSRTSHQTEGD